MQGQSSKHRSYEGKAYEGVDQDKILEFADSCHSYEISRALPISTRTIGFSIQSTYSMIMNGPHYRGSIPTMTVYQWFRVSLAMAEQVVSHNSKELFIGSSLWYNPYEIYGFNGLKLSYLRCSQRTGVLLKSIRNFNYKGINYVPIFPANRLDTDGRTLPLPECVYFTNLRKVVEYLSDETTPLEIRENFHNKSPLPRAKWGERSVLTNPDDFMPAQYGPDDLQRDISDVQSWIHKCSRFFPKLFTNFSICEEGTGNECVLLSNSSGTLRCEDDGTSNMVVGNVSEFWSPVNIPDTTAASFGVYALAGEVASVPEYANPYYSFRQDCNACMRMVVPYHNIVQMVE